MGSRYSLNYATVDIAGVISVPSYQKGGYVRNWISLFTQRRIC